VWDGHLESRKNPDRQKRSIHVDRIGVHSTFVYTYAGLRALMIWANCLFAFNMSFLLKSRRCDDNQQTAVSHFGEHKRLHLESSKRNYYIISFTSNNKSNLHHYISICMCMCVLIYLLYICLDTYIYKCKVHMYRDTTASEQCYFTGTGNCVNVGPVSFPLMSFHRHAFSIYSGKTLPKYTHCDMYIRICIRNICMFTFIYIPI